VKSTHCYFRHLCFWFFDQYGQSLNAPIRCQLFNPADF
jgi:hypothetical protein